MSVDVRIGHLGWSQYRAGLEVLDGNDPREPREARRLMFANGREGATVVVVVLPGRFSDDAEHVAAVVANALTLDPDEPA